VIAQTEGQIFVDATDCPVPVKINGGMVSKQVLRPNDILRIGNSIWRINLPVAEAPSDLQHKVNSIRKGFTNFIGLEELKDFKLGNIFGQVFKKHSIADMEDQLITGTINKTPALTDIETDWAKPWLFSRMLLACAILTIALDIVCKVFSDNPIMIPGLMFVGAFAVPMSTLVFYLEMNAPRNLSIFAVLTMFFTGGIASIGIALTLFSRLEFLETALGASAAGIIEEWSKLLIVVLLFGRFERLKWILNGMLLGAAIGAGFGAFESAGYAFGSGNFEGIVDSIILRALLAPFMHVVWTANAAGALWLVKGNRKFQWNMLGDMRFLRVMASSMAIHMIWNAPFGILPLPVFPGLDVKHIILGVLAWIITFRLIQAGLKQLNDARRAEVERLSAV
jgi:RsiW-degrading membrane proteinase PrsW (M82 family)